MDSVKNFGNFILRNISRPSYDPELSKINKIIECCLKPNYDSRSGPSQANEYLDRINKEILEEQIKKIKNENSFNIGNTQNGLLDSQFPISKPNYIQSNFQKSTSNTFNVIY